MAIKKQIHLIGIGGTGMTALANLLLEKGHSLSGSDKNDFSARKILEKKGIKIYIGHKADNVKKADIVVYSSAIPNDNIELKTAEEMKIPLFNRFDFLMNVLTEKKIISVAGTHGKSTTVAMITHILEKAELKPTVYLGAKNKAYPLGSKWNSGKYAVLETDEHDKSFLKAPSFFCVITNVDNDHLDIDGPYKGQYSLLKKAFKKFSKNSQSGFIVLNNDDHFLRKIAKEKKKKTLTFGIDNKADLFVKNINYKGIKTFSDLFLSKKFQGKLELSVPGKENIYNALGAILVSQILKIPLDDALQYLKTFTGIERRFSILYDKKIAIVDDYAHHPTAIEGTLRMARIVFPKRRIVLVLEPHRYSRISLLYKNFALAIKNCDALFLLPLDSSNEKPIKGINSEKIYKEILKKRTLSKNQLYLVKDEKSFLKNLFKFKKNGDVFLFTGPGKIANLPKKFIRLLKKYEKNL
ncbi:MAG TPA: UDP-N-acetylmuramate--L-alanine ligase [Candidatus Paceibacterota bacterium]|nr:UDP-N-acetylmuramate--L-alanine ligase [Candidatus Paceibacterota bacterium]